MVLVGSFSGSSHEKQQISSAHICERAQTLCRRMKVLFLAPRPDCNALNYGVFTSMPPAVSVGSNINLLS